MSDSPSKLSNQELDPEITLGVLNAVESNDAVTQRSLAKELGIALGMANAYLKRCAKKGLIKVTQAPANRYLYYLTPQGFGEKSRLTAHYLTTSFNFFRAARKQCEEIFETCDRRNWKKVVLYGKSDLAEIATLSAGETSVEIIGVVAPGSNQDTFVGLKVYPNFDDLRSIDAVVITDLSKPQACFDELAQHIPTDRILAPRFMHISRVKPSLAE
ncbi:MAG: winged helix-turn-helix transcriptional regulator [Rhodospirillales bacterium]